MGRGGPHTGLTDGENVKKMTNLNRELIGILATIAVDDQCLVPIHTDKDGTVHLEDLPDPSTVFATELVELSNALDAGMRDAYVEGIKAATPEKVGLSIAAPQPQNGNGGQAVEVRPKRGL